MPKTGIYFIDSFSGVCFFLPLLAVIIIFLKKGYHNEPMNFLMILCFLSFIESVLLSIPGMTDITATVIRNIFLLLELVIIILIFKNSFPEKMNYVLTIFVVIFFSSLITYYIINGLNQNRTIFLQMQNGIIIFIAVFAMAQILQTENLLLLKTPLFWTAAGTIFYFSISLLVHAVGQTSVEKNQTADADSMLILNIANAARYIFYTAAGIFYNNNNDEEKN